MICLTIFIPPLVEPAEPPIKNKENIMAVTIEFHIVKSADTKPVVVNTETTEKAACLKALSVSPQFFE